MSAIVPPGRPSHRKAHAGRGGKKREADSAGQSSTASPRKSIALATAELARALPELVRHALSRARKGKPVSLLRTVRGLIRELEELLPPPPPKAHDQLGVLSPMEEELCRNLVELIRTRAPEGGALDPEHFGIPQPGMDTPQPQVSNIPLDTTPKTE